jgi:hypothetical protein
MGKSFPKGGAVSELKRVFEAIASGNKWLNHESRSGDGSTLFYTRHLRAELERFIREFEVKSFFDAPCGDFNWMRAVNFPADLIYVGGDIVGSLVEANNRTYAGSMRSFIDFDIVSDDFPAADLWFCRDCLFHLSNGHVLQALRNFAGSKMKLLMMTNHINTAGFVNGDIKSGGFRLIDFFFEPYCLPRDVLFRVTDYIDPYPPREMCVWTREEIAAALVKAPSAAC